MARILLADDEDGLRELVALVLEMEAHVVVQAADGEACLAAIADGTFDLVITDLVMPGKGGLETIRALRASYPTLPIIAMSGGGRGSASDVLPAARHGGAVRTLDKPFANDELLAVVRDALAS